ncbi:MAG: orotidine-5'-phosphate decarboxylase [Candidatus Delongbacteria bacterium]|nr:orotidine-5'-phosphate decarboxylase [Candidatus Delongbacteria bacterium]
MNFTDKVISTIKTRNSALCVGLDVDLAKMPEILKNEENPIVKFNKEIIEATKEYVAAFKPNLAFYEQFGTSGISDFEKTLSYIDDDVFVIADAKRGDIGNTSAQYAKTFLECYGFDSITVAPYMGEDSVSPFLTVENKWVVLLALTSNKGAFDFQLIENKETGKRLFEEVLETSQKWGNAENMMYVVGATKAEMLADIRKIVPEHFLLVPGVGAQGGSLQEVAKYGLNSQCGLIVNSSRGIIFKSSEKDFAEVAQSEAKKLQEEMAEILAANKLI